MATAAEPGEGEACRLPRLLRPLDTALAFAACTATALVVILVTIEVVARYAFASSIFFANELSRLMFVWGIFLGFPLALSRGRHVGIELIDAVLPQKAVRLAIRFGALLGALLLTVTGWKTVDVMLFNWDQRMNTLPVSAGLFYVPIAIGMAVGAIYLVVIAYTATRSLVPDAGGDPLD